MNLPAAKPPLPAGPEPLAQALFLQIIDSYIRYYAGGNSHTARAKRYDLGHFLEFLAQHTNTAMEKLRVRDWDFSAVQRFVDHCLESGEAPATVARRLATLKHFGRTLADRVPGFVNPAREVKQPRLPTQKPKGLTAEQISQIRERAEERYRQKPSFNRFRNKMIFTLLVDTGLRADEIRLLKLSQIDEKLEWIQQVRTKGRKYRNVYITSAVRPQLQEYLAARERELKRSFPELSRTVNQSLPLFISTYKVSATKAESFFLGEKTIWRGINELSAGLHLHPHLLRHAFALDLLDETQDVRLVSQALGHSDVRITMRYTERRDEDIADALERSRRRRT